MLGSSLRRLKAGPIEAEWEKDAEEIRGELESVRITPRPGATEDEAPAAPPPRRPPTLDEGKNELYAAMTRPPRERIETAFRVMLEQFAHAPAVMRESSDTVSMIARMGRLKENWANDDLDTLQPKASEFISIALAFLETIETANREER